MSASIVERWIDAEEATDCRASDRADESGIAARDELPDTVVARLSDKGTGAKAEDDAGLPRATAADSRMVLVSIVTPSRDTSPKK